MHRFPDHDTLLGFVRSADAEISAAAVSGAILHVNDLAPVDACFRWSTLDGAHPLDLLLGFVAPPHWRALGVSCAGLSRRLADDGDDATPHRLADAASRPVPVTVTLLLDRSGDAASVMRRAEEVSVMDEAPEGVVADACRRALGLPTAPPPPSTLGLWTLTWLDRVVDAAGRAPVGAGLRSWSAVARLHAAAGPLGDIRAPVGDPASLAAAAAALARAWPWGRLRADPSILDGPGPPPSDRLAGWMDDGMWARWLLSRLPAPDDLMAAVHALLPPALAAGVEIVAGAAWPPS
jgi:hypothetical protein